jgi:hypothetical protein
VNRGSSFGVTVFWVEPVREFMKLDIMLEMSVEFCVVVVLF